ncbi:hypothetical protein DAPPUDRAFT_105027 [Daphnia pulex]|uniref:Uncharacterized protein n=1 Tax=Daphnia pulex TaxID=6669 RepID=E9GP59_DAPPU|nr:hypothetical protein DAPPUDRAFT_105027 [Daphnia pulex]|eukprot:EFX78582.1 hypothetical protein DAPPUDRAFT_105027 [Daphnia pulex]
MASQWDLSACDIDRGKLMISTRDPCAISITSQNIATKKKKKKKKKKKRYLYLLSAYINLFAASLGVDPALRECLWRCDERNCPLLPGKDALGSSTHHGSSRERPAVRCPSDVPVTSQLSRPWGSLEERVGP